MIQAVWTMIRLMPSVVREVERFVHGEEIEVGTGADDPLRGIR